VRIAIPWSFTSSTPCHRELAGAIPQFAVDRRHSEIPSHRQHDVIVLDQDVVCLNQTYPADLLAAPQRTHAMGRVSASSPACRAAGWCAIAR